MATLDERISALVDDELVGSEMKSAVQSLHENSDAIRCWDRYHLIGDVLRRGQPVLGDPLFSQRVRTSLTELPTTLSPKPFSQEDSDPVRPALGVQGLTGGLRHLAGFAVAASVTVVAILGARQLSEVEVNPAPTVVRAPVPAPFVATAPVRAAGWQGNLPYTVADYSTGSYTADDIPGVQREIMGILPYASLIDSEALDR